ncbi:MAG: hypothetical protein HQL29_05350, partial [Candidatus Omnitrophica bacterium]|nr:hypothetical protein [Candidatus Omnitrophota bacterium]
MKRTISIILCFIFLTIEAHPLGIWTPREGRISTSEARDMLYRMEFEKRLAPKYGGKLSWDIILNRVVERLGLDVSLPESAYFSMEDVWDVFVEGNKTLIEEGNRLVSEALKVDTDELTSEQIDKLKEILVKMKYPPELDFLVEHKCRFLKGPFIARSSGRYEDGYDKNLAGVFTSPVSSSASGAVREMLMDSVEKIWFHSKELSTLGAQVQITKKDGFGILLQSFKNFDSGGTLMSNYHGKASIECCFGDVKTAVSGIKANTAQFLFDKNTGEYEFDTSYVNYPYTFKVNDGDECKEFNIIQNKDKMIKIMERYPIIGGVRSPIDENMAFKLFQISAELEKEIGVPLDLEWGVKDGKLYIIQMRPIIGDKTAPLTVKDEKAFEGKKQVASTPIADGATSPQGFTGKMVLFGAGFTRNDIEKFDSFFGEEYILVADDLAPKIPNKTRAKVLVDPWNGAKQAHNIIKISDRIANDEFVYCNSPVLKKGLLGELYFLPVENMPGVWIADRPVTYFSTGLKAEFYVKDEDVEWAELQKTLNGRAKYDPEYLMFFDEICKGDKGPFAYVQDAIVTFGLGGFDELRKYFLPEQYGEPDIEKTVMSCTLKGEGDLESSLKSLKELESFINFPLMPSEEDNEIVTILKRGINRFFVDYNEYFSKKDEPVPEHDSYRVFMYECHPGRYEEMENKLKKIKHCGVVNIYDGNEASISRYQIKEGRAKIGPGSDGWIEFDKALQKVGYDVDVLVIHMGNIANVKRTAELILKVLKINPEAKIAVESAASRALREFLSFFNRADTKDVKTYETGSFDKIKELKEIQNLQKVWLNKNKEHLGINDGNMGKKEGPMNILVADDDAGVLSALCRQVNLSLSAKDFVLTKAGTADDIRKALRQKSYDLIIYDGQMLEGKKNLISELAQSDAALIMNSYWDRDEAAKILGPIIISATDSFLSKDDLENYDVAGEIEKAFSAWKRTMGKDEPVKDDKSSFESSDNREKLMIIAEHLKDRKYTAEEIERTFPGKYDIKVVDGIISIEQEFAGFVPDVVIVDEMIHGERAVGIVDSALSKYNPEAGMIILSKDPKASETSKEFKISKRLYGHRLFENHEIILSLKGTSKDDKAIAAEKFAMEYSSKIFRNMGKTSMKDQPLTIRIWEGYLETDKDGSLKNMIQRKTRGSGYSIEFLSAEEIHKLAKAGGKEVNILPSSGLDEIERSDLSVKGMNTMFMELDKHSKIYAGSSFIRLGLIIYLGITYYENDAGVFKELLDLLGDERNLTLSLEKVKNNPGTNAIWLNRSIPFDPGQMT